MNTRRIQACFGVLWLAHTLGAGGVTHYVSPDGGHVSPFTNWADAARDIQSAVDAASAGAVILVTNGVYSTGGRAVTGAMTNRVVLDKAVWVRSVNGPSVTIIAGLPCPTNGGNGDGAIRCVYMANGPMLAGFTLTNGHTRAVNDPSGEKTSGGAVWAPYGAARDAVVSNCVIAGNSSSYNAGGVAGSVLYACRLEGNEARMSGGGADDCELYNCILRGNKAYGGGGVSYSEVHNCTVVQNTGTNRGGGVAYCTCFNSILYNNTSPGGSNFYFWRYSNCCLYPMSSSGGGNITNDPCFADSSAGDFSLSGTSPCINAGVDLGWMAAAGDFDQNPRVVGLAVDIGAYEYQNLSEPLAVSIGAEDAQAAVGVDLPLVGRVVGNAQGFVWDFGDGHAAANRLSVSNAYAAEGFYDAILTASNLAGSVSATVRVEIVGADYAYYVALDGDDAAAGTNWATAKATIQAAVDAAGRGCRVWVTNGVYDTGVRLADGSLTNRAVVDKPLMLSSVNGPGVTCIAGRPHDTNAPNGDVAVRGVYLAEGARLEGFTVSNGHTRMSGDLYRDRSGGGIYCATNAAVVSNCVVTGNAADYAGGGTCRGTLHACSLLGNSASNSGGGAHYGVLNYCLVSGNTASDGGGAGSCQVLNSVIRGNRAARHGGGLYSSATQARNCTVAGNTAAVRGGGAYLGTMENCVLYYNTAASYENFYQGVFTNCCTMPAPTGLNNLTGAPWIVSAADPRLMPGSPCIDAGTNQDWMSGAVDWDGYPRIVNTVVDIGAFEYYSDSVLTGALSAAIVAAYTQAPTAFEIAFAAEITGRARGYTWAFGDGADTANLCQVSHAYSTGGWFDVSLAVSNESGTVTAGVRIVILQADCRYYVSPDGDDLAAGTNWATAKATIQAAVDAASMGCDIWVSNGLYAEGGRAVQAGLANRVAVDKPVYVRSVNGPDFTCIAGQSCPTSGGTGAGAVRGVYLDGGARLEGFTITNGFTLDWGVEQKQGGGIWCAAAGAGVSNCVITDCGARQEGGGGYWGTYRDCLFRGNTANSGGGAWDATLYHCFITNNQAQYGGGSGQCVLQDCRLDDNTADGTHGGGAYRGSLENCILAGNAAWDSGGGAYDASMSGCVLERNEVWNSTGEGGGAWGGTLMDCELRHNSATGSMAMGGGTAYSDLSGCLLVSNRAAYGGGAYGGTVSNSSIRWNVAAHAGGGAQDSDVLGCDLYANTASNAGGICRGTASDCVLSNNAAHTTRGVGGGAYEADLRRCWVRANSAWEGGGAYRCDLQNCVLTENTADNGAGASSSEGHNCTLVNNHAINFGGGSFWGVFHNSILYYNTAFASPNWYMGSFTNCCSSPEPDGTNNMASAPRFVDYAHGDVRLQSNSPCINRGTNQTWMTGARDLDGNHRVILKVVDLGAYEYTFPGQDGDADGILDAYESGTGHYQDPQDTGTDPFLADTDGDRLPDGDELVAGTDPTDAASWLGLVDPAEDGLPIEPVIRWTSESNIQYRVERSADLAADFDTVVRSNILATPAVNILTDETAVGTGPFHYRIRVTP